MQTTLLITKKLFFNAHLNSLKLISLGTHQCHSAMYIAVLPINVCNTTHVTQLKHKEMHCKNRKHRRSWTIVQWHKTFTSAQAFILVVKEWQLSYCDNLSGQKMQLLRKRMFMCQQSTWLTRKKLKRCAPHEFFCSIT